MDMEMHSREVTVPRWNRASEWSSSRDGDMRSYEVTSRRHDTSSTPELETVNPLGLDSFIGETAAMFEVLVRAVWNPRSKKYCKQVA
jgi:hypothetical protein